MWAGFSGVRSPPPRAPPALRSREPAEARRAAALAGATRLHLRGDPQARSALFHAPLPRPLAAAEVARSWTPERWSSPTRSARVGPRSSCSRRRAAVRTSRVGAGRAPSASARTLSRSPGEPPLRSARRCCDRCASSTAGEPGRTAARPQAESSSCRTVLCTLCPGRPSSGGVPRSNRRLVGTGSSSSNGSPSSRRSLGHGLGGAEASAQESRARHGDGGGRAREVAVLDRRVRRSGPPHRPIDARDGLRRKARGRGPGPGPRPHPAALLAREVEGIAQLFPGQVAAFLGPEATEERAKSLPRQIRIVHFATHGFADERFPLDSGLVLTSPERFDEKRRDGLLQAWEILEGGRLEADLVVLSACESDGARSWAERVC